MRLAAAGLGLATAVLVAGCGSVSDSTEAPVTGQAGATGSECATAYAAAGKALETSGALIGPGIAVGEPARLLLSFDTLAQRDAAASGLGDVSGLRVMHAYRHLPILMVGAAPVTDAMLALLKARFDDAGLLSIYPDAAMQLLLMDSNEFTGAGYARRELALDGKGVGVAVIDSGINELQGDFANVVANYRVVGNICWQIAAPPEGECPAPVNEQNVFEFVDVTGTNSDSSSGHGTHVAGTVAGTGEMSGGRIQGMAPGASLVGFSAGEGIAIFVAYALAAYDEIIELKDEFNIRVTNNSWGGGSEGLGFQPFNPISVATKKLHDAGVYSVFAVGNTGAEGPGATSQMISHATSPCVIGVGAGMANAHVTTPYNWLIHDGEAVLATEPSALVESGDARGRLAWFSSRGKKGDPYDHPDVIAPGDYVASAFAGPTALAMFAGTGGPFVEAGVLADPTTGETSAYYWRASGTSMASPHVAGIVALMLQADPSLSLDEVVTILGETADPVTKADGSPREAWEVGAGFVDVDQALARVSGQPLPDRTFAFVTEFSGEIAEAASVPFVTPVVESQGESTFVLPPGNYARVEVFVSWGNPLNDVDITVLDPDGYEVGSSANFSPFFETAYLEAPLVPGTYRVVVDGYNNTAETFAGRVVAYRF